MRQLPFKRTYPEHEDILGRARVKFHEVKEETRRRLGTSSPQWVGRVGLGVVYTTSGIQFPKGLGLLLSSWRWRHGFDGLFIPDWLGAEEFSDDPALVAPHAGFDFRVTAAIAFAEAANAVLKPEGGEFRARPLELVRASSERPAGFHRGDEADVLAIDLMLGQRDHAIINQLVHDIWAENPLLGGSNEVSNEHVELWHRVERLNEARRFLEPGSPPVKLPGMAATRRRVRAHHEAWYERYRAGLEKWPH